MLINLFKGIAIGMIIGMPFGPIGALCLKNTLTFGRRYGLISGLGAAFTDSIYASLVLMSFMLIKKFVVLHELYLRIIGGLILVCFGMFSIYPVINRKHHITLNIKKINKKDISQNNNLLFKTFTSTFLISLANPTTALLLIAIFTGLHLSNVRISPINKYFLILGIFTGCMIWWFILVSTAGKFTSKLKVENKFFLNKILDLAITIGGIIIFLSAFISFRIRRPSLLNLKLFNTFKSSFFKIPWI